jgi:hypothetical protein
MRASLAIVCCLVGWVSIHAEELPQGGDHPAVARYRHRAEKSTVSGAIVDGKGQAVAGATVYCFGYQRQMCPFPKVPCLELGRTTTDGSGKFTLNTSTMADTKHQLCVIAKGHGAAFVDVDLDNKTVDTGKITLPAEQTIRGKVVGPDGKPAGKVTLEVNSLMSEAFVGYWLASPNPGKSASPLKATTDADGTFELHGLPADTVEIWFKIDDERYALHERTSFVDAIRHKEGILRPKEMAGKPVEIKLSAPVYVTGTVTRKDTGTPIANAWVGVTFCDIEVAADSHHEGIWVQTDAKGRYRARCGPWANRVHAYCFAPPGTPCPDWSAGPIEVPKDKAEFSLDIVMPVGILLTGKIIDKASGKPIAGAGFIHIHRREKPKTLKMEDSLRLYWANEYHYRFSNADGSFEQPVLPGESGVLLVKAPGAGYVSKITSCGEILTGKAAPWWSVVEGLADVTTKTTDKALSLDIPLTRGVTTSGTVTGPKGEAVPRCVVFTATPRHAHHQQYYGGDEWNWPVQDGRWTIDGCDPSSPTELYFFDPEHQWGTTVKYDPKTQGDKPLKVTLEPCGSAKVKCLTPDKKPMTGEAGAMAIGFSTALVVGFQATEAKEAMGFPQEFHFGRHTLYLDPTRYEKLVPDKDGVIVYPSLIPGAPYKWVTANVKNPISGPAKSTALTVKPGETIDLGEATIPKLDMPTEPGK